VRCKADRLQHLQQKLSHTSRKARRPYLNLPQLRFELPTNRMHVPASPFKTTRTKEKTVNVGTGNSIRSMDW
jgi:hypothetical protein